MSWQAVRLPLLLGVGFALPALMVAGFKAIPKEWLEVKQPPKPPAIEVSREPVRIAIKAPSVSLDPFKPLSGSAPIANSAAEPVRTAETPVITSQVAPPNPKISAPEAELPDPRLEGIVGGDDPVAVLSIDGDSQFARIGDVLRGGIKVLSITESEVKLLRGSSELVLKTGIR